MLNIKRNYLYNAKSYKLYLFNARDLNLGTELYDRYTIDKLVFFQLVVKPFIAMFIAVTVLLAHFSELPAFRRK